MIFARPKAEFDQSARVGDGLALPSVIGLEAAHGGFAGVIPRSGGFSGQIMLTDQRFLNGLRALGIDLLLATNFRRFLLAAR